MTYILLLQLVMCTVGFFAYWQTDKQTARSTLTALSALLKTGTMIYWGRWAGSKKWTLSKGKRGR